MEDLYARQIILPGFESKQKLLAGAWVIIVGAGGLGVAVIPHMAGVGVKRITIIDHDRVAMSNLHRQVLYGKSTVGKYKAECAVAKCHDLQPDGHFEAITEQFPEGARVLQVLKELASYPGRKAVIDCTDNLPTRLAICDICVLLKLPVVTGSALRFQGQVLLYNISGERGCYRCLLDQKAQTHYSFPPSYVLSLQDLPAILDHLRAFTPQPAQDCSSAGVLGPVPSMIGMRMALNAIHLLTGDFDDPQRYYNYFTYDYTDLRFPDKSTKILPRVRHCETCGSNTSLKSQTIEDLIAGRKAQYTQRCASETHPVIPADLCKEWREVLDHLHEGFFGLERPPTQWQILDVRPLEVVNAKPFPTVWKDSLTHSPMEEICFAGKRLVRCWDLKLSVVTEEFSVLDELDSDNRPLLVVCERGNASRTATFQLYCIRALIKANPDWSRVWPNLAEKRIYNCVGGRLALLRLHSQ